MTNKLKEKCKELIKREFRVGDTLILLQSNGFKFWSWGSSNFTNFENKGLLFKVNGYHHKGYVLITLDWTDTYDVYILSTHGNVIDTYNMVYFDMLFDIIDNRVERIPEYKI